MLTCTKVVRGGFSARGLTSDARRQQRSTPTSPAPSALLEGCTSLPWPCKGDPLVTAAVVGAVRGRPPPKRPAVWVWAWSRTARGRWMCARDAPARPSPGILPAVLPVSWFEKEPTIRKSADCGRAHVSAWYRTREGSSPRSSASRIFEFNVSSTRSSTTTAIVDLVATLDYSTFLGLNISDD